MQELFNSTEVIYLCLAFMVICMALSLGCYFLFKKVFNYHPLKKNKDILGGMFAAICLLHSLILAFAIVAVWEDYEDINATIIEETERLQGIKLQANDLPATYFMYIDSTINHYARHEMKHLKDNDNNMVVKSRLFQLKHALYELDTMHGVDNRVIDAINNDINDVIDLRHKRHSHINSHIPGLIWLVLITGSILVIFFAYMFLAGIGWDEYLYLLLLSGMLSTCLFLIYALDHPFYGSSGVSVEPFRQIIS